MSPEKQKQKTFSLLFTACYKNKGVSLKTVLCLNFQMIEREEKQSGCQVVYYTLKNGIFAVEFIFEVLHPKGTVTCL